jgi:hypothetical protein
MPLSFKVNSAILRRSFHSPRRPLTGATQPRTRVTRAAIGGWFSPGNPYCWRLPESIGSPRLDYRERRLARQATFASARSVSAATRRLQKHGSARRPCLSAEPANCSCPSIPSPDAFRSMRCVRRRTAPTIAAVSTIRSSLAVQPSSCKMTIHLRCTPAW